MIDSGREALAALVSLGLKVQPIFGMSPDTVGRDDLVEQMLDWLLAGFVLPTTKTTVLQDWMKGRHSEVDDINGNVVSALAASGEDAPVNRAVIELARRIEAHDIDPGPENLDALLTEAAANGWTP